MAQKLKGIADDSLAQINLGGETGFVGGLNTMDSPLAIASNQSPSLQNCFGIPGRLQYCGGYNEVSTLPYAADAAWEFYDVNNNRHEVVWAGGNLYDCVSGTPVLIASAKYTAGQQVGRVDLGGILYYTTATVPLRQWNGTTEMAVPQGSDVGNVPPPSGTYLAAYAGSLIMANPTIIDSGTFYYPGAFLYSNVNDPTNWIAANINQLGSNQFIQWIIPLGVSAAGVPPTGSFMIGCTNNIFVYQGPLNNLTQHIVNSPVGAFDANSAQFIPSEDLFPGIIFIGSDCQWWFSNGIATQCISLKIQNYANSSIQNARLLSQTQRFFSGYNAQWHYYVCDLGSNQQFAYRWSDKAWYYFQGWPSGAIVTGHDANGFVTLFSASNSNGLPNGYYQLGITGTNFGGTPPTIFYQTPYLHGGDSNLQKDYQWAVLDMLDNYASYSVQGQTLPNAQNSVLLSNILIFNPPTTLNLNNPGIWNQSLWNQATWGGIATSSSGPAIEQGMLCVAAPATKWGRASTQPLRSGAVSFTIRWIQSGNSPAFDITGLRIRFYARGRKTVGGQLYTAQSGTTGSGRSYYSPQGSQ